MNGKSCRTGAMWRALIAGLSVVLGVLLIGNFVGAANGEQGLKRQAVQPKVATAQSLEARAAKDEWNPAQLAAAAPQSQGLEAYSDAGSQTRPGEETLNILLIGQDTGSKRGARADTIILCTLNREKRTITLTSFLRDLYVTIPGHGKNRINAAHSFGGMELLDDTLYENFGVQVHGNVRVDFDHFEEIINLLGGVTVDLTKAEARFIRRHVPESKVTEGSQLLSGAEALAYARDRNDVDGDFSRTNRQRKLLRALVNQCKTLKLRQALSLLNDILPMVTTDISKTELLSYVVAMLPVLAKPEIKTLTIPVADGFRYDRISGMSVLVPDMKKNMQALTDALS